MPCIVNDAYIIHGDASPVLGRASKHLYIFLRTSLQVPFLCTSRLITPASERVGATESNEEHLTITKEAQTVGSYLGVVYRAIGEGILPNIAVDILQEIREPCGKST